MGAATDRAEPAAGDPRPSHGSNRRGKDGNHRSQPERASPISEEALAPAPAGRLLGEEDPNVFLLADAPALFFSADAPPKLEPGTFRLLVPSRAQVNS